eukprot:CAMPEP_0172765558 /NCGR_PEP_ID=MMETSP1074-20121228/179543_1 /TAXON_ID=2916 /ORGANISM="Ceratium fusus, Strain PA161109" /LENGTH=58 /DNA_ID=CAMNT_0013600531 /DNA_START=65 /DNA_END=237 /DNA_ORIENTATION=+
MTERPHTVCEEIQAVRPNKGSSSTSLFCFELASAAGLSLGALQPEQRLMCFELDEFEG